jgi:protein transport protein SEC61 subunit alpha
VKMGAVSNFIKGVSTILPEIKKPTRKPSLNEKLIWTAVALVVYMVMAVTPLTGVPIGTQSQFSYSSIIFASSQGTLMTLGIGPIVTAGLILQLLAGSEIIRVDFQNPEDRAIFTSATKFLTIIVIIVEASAYLIGGLFGSINSGASVVIFFELFVASVIVMLLDELVQKGWGIGSGVSLFILAGVAQKVMWNIFAPIVVPISSGSGTTATSGVYFGSIPFLINTTAVGRPLAAFFRANTPQFPSIFGLILTIVAIFIIVYVEGMRIEIPITSTKYRGFAGVYPIKLLYVSNIPVILFAALLANISFFFAYLWKIYDPNNTVHWFNYIAQYNLTDIANNAQSSPLNYQPLHNSLIYYMTAPTNPVYAPGTDWLRALTYVVFAVMFSVMFAKVWVEVGGLSPKAAAKSLIGADVMVPGFRRTGTSVESILAKYIPTITVIGGIFVGLLAGLTQLLGVYGTGIGLLLMVDIIIQYYQMLVKEQLESMMPRLGSFLGRT